MPSESSRLSKSRYLSGLQCHKQLWWRVHEPEAPELSPTPGQQNLFAQGREVGERARGHVPGGELIDLPFYQYDNKVTATREALRRGRPAIYEAWFLADDTYVGVDILERTSRGYTVIEVKASNSRKPEHLPDAAVQVHVLRGAGLQVERAEVMHLNPECRYPDLSNLFVREDVTALVEAALIGVPDELAAQQRMLEGPLPDVPIGEHCTRPYDCPFIERCWPKVPDHHVSKLYRIERKRALELEADGYATIYDLPPDLAEALVEACVGARKVVAYHATFERECIKQLREAVPRFAKELERIEKRLVDLLPAIRSHVYHPDFGGGFSIKKTLPALVPGLSYADLKVQDGEVATVELQRLMLEGDRTPPAERAALRDALLAYCARDTWAMVKLLEKLRGLVADQLELF